MTRRSYFLHKERPISCAHICSSGAEIKSEVMCMHVSIKSCIHKHPDVEQMSTK